MKKFKIIIPTAILLAVLVIGLGIGWEEARAESQPLKLQVPLGSVEFLDPPYLVGYLKALFEYFVGITAILAAVAMMYAGYQWIFASGNQAKISSAKQTVGNAAVGLTLALTAYIILNTLNPRIVQLEFPDVDIDLASIGMQAACSSGSVDITDSEGNCKSSSQIPCNVLCVDYAGGSPPFVYGDCQYCSNPLAASCGTHTRKLPCDIDGCGCWGTYTGAVQKGCFIKGEHGSTTKYFQIEELISIPGADERGFLVNKWKGDDGQNLITGFGTTKFECGELWYHKGRYDDDGLYGTYCNGEKNKCVIDVTQGVNWDMDFATCAAQSGRWCNVGRFPGGDCPSGISGVCQRELEGRGTRD